MKDEVVESSHKKVLILVLFSFHFSLPSSVNDNIPLDRQRRRNKNARLHCKIKQLETGCVKDYDSLKKE